MASWYAGADLDSSFSVGWSTWTTFDTTLKPTFGGVLGTKLGTFLVIFSTTLDPGLSAAPAVPVVAAFEFLDMTIYTTLEGLLESPERFEAKSLARAGSSLAAMLAEWLEPFFDTILNTNF